MPYFEVFTPFPQCEYPLLPSNSSDPETCDLTFADVFPVQSRSLRAIGVAWSAALLVASVLELLGNLALSVQRSRRRGQRTTWLREWWAMRTFKGRALISLMVLLAVNVIRAVDIRGSAGLVPVALELALDQIGVILSALIGAFYAMSVTGIVMNRRHARRRASIRISAGTAAALALAMPLIVIILATLDGLPGRAGVVAFACRILILGFGTAATGVVASIYTLPEWRRMLFPTDVLPHPAPARTSSEGLLAAPANAVGSAALTSSPPLSDVTCDSDSTKTGRTTVRGGGGGGAGRGARERAVQEPESSSVSVAPDAQSASPAAPSAAAPPARAESTMPIRIFSVNSSAEFAGPSDPRGVRDPPLVYGAPAQQRLEPLRPPFPVYDPQLPTSSTPVPTATDIQLSAADQQLSSTDQQLSAADQQLSAAEQQLSMPDGAFTTPSVVPSLPALRGFPTTDTYSTEGGASHGTYPEGSEIYGYARAPAPLRRLPPSAAAEHMSANLRRPVSGVILRIMIVSIAINFLLFAAGLALIVVGAVSFSASHPASLTVSGVTPASFWASFNVVVTFWTLPPLMLLVISNGAIAVLPLWAWGAAATTCCGAPPPQPARRGHVRQRRISGSARVAAPINLTARGVSASSAVAAAAAQGAAAAGRAVTPARGRAPVAAVAPSGDAAAAGTGTARVATSSQGPPPGIGGPPRPRIVVPVGAIVVSEQLTPIAEERDASSDFSRSELGTAALRG